jgi:hypothetical protein
MTAAQQSVVVGIFDDPAQAEKAIRDLLDAGFTRDRIGFAMRHPAEPEHAAEAGKADNALGAVVGGYTGVAAGGILGGLIGLAISAAVPGVGPVLAAGLVGMALGGAYVGGLVGALVGLGVPQHEAEHYHRHVQEGRALVAVQCAGRYSEALAILSANGARDAVRETSLSQG